MKITIKELKNLIKEAISAAPDVSHVYAGEMYDDPEGTSGLAKLFHSPHKFWAGDEDLEEKYSNMRHRMEQKLVLYFMVKSLKSKPKEIFQTFKSDPDMEGYLSAKQFLTAIEYAREEVKKKRATKDMPNKPVPARLEPVVAQARELLSKLDFHYQYSDDPGAYRRGMAQYNKAIDFLKNSNLPQPVINQLWAEYAPQDQKQNPPVK